MTIGMTIDGMLQKLGKTQSWLARELGISRSTLWRICSGKIKPGEKIMMKLSEIFILENNESKNNFFFKINDFNKIVTLSTLKKIMKNPAASVSEKQKIEVVIKMISGM